jgi:hypothetical protein
MDLDLYRTEGDLDDYGEWPDAIIGSQPVLDCPADTKWQDGPDERFGCIKGVVMALFLSLPLWAVIVGGGKFLFRT